MAAITGLLRGQVAKLANVHAETLRYYEELGLIAPPLRSDSGYRLYTEEVLEQLVLIQNAKSCGFTLKEIQKALVKSKENLIDIHDFLKVIDEKTNKIRKEIAQREQTADMLEQLRQDLQAADKHPGTQATLRALNME
ncbi:MerR family transcriptional regulator [Paenibacillus radicis (ex Gao et al. 2016)]|nr:MerR family transcriptional regulator [Paenibacillus radicis (ex Gao et al. 2016)]